MRCAACNVILSHSEMASDKEDGSMNDICYSCQPYINDPDFCLDREYQFEVLTEVPFQTVVTRPTPSPDNTKRPRGWMNYYQ